jgi:copper(I)-binding protein
MKLQSIGVVCFMLGLLPNVVSSTDSAIVIRDAWIREAPPNSTALAGYMILENQSDKSQSLTSVSATAFGRVMIHRTEQKDGMAHMTHQKQVTIPANGEVVFAPGGYHLMLMHPKRPLHADDQATINFVFADESKLSVIFKVRKDMPMKGEEGMKHHHGM